MLVESTLAGESVATSAPSSAGLVSNAQDLSEMFLRLLVEELSHQDPLNPVDGSEFVAQLAQLGSVEQMQKMNANLEDVILTQQLGQATTLIGRRVQATGPDGSVLEGVVTGISLRSGVVRVEVASQAVPLNAVFAVSAVAEKGFDTQLAYQEDDEAQSKTYNLETEV